MVAGNAAAAAIILLAVILTAGFEQAHSATVVYNFTITYGFWSPDCVERLVYLVNGQYPGPTIFATEGDTIVVNVINEMETDGVTIHWHGITQKSTPYNDGAAYITQCPIQGGETYQYKFAANKAGTYFYHSHLALQRSHGLYGKLIVEDAAKTVLPYKYDAELEPIIINDWWHKSAGEQEAGLQQIPFRFVGEPQSLLFNGRGKYNCSLIPQGVAGSGDTLPCNNSNPQCNPHAFTVTAGKTFLLRISSAGSLSSQNIAFAPHTVTVVTADSYRIKPFTTNQLDVYAGQTYDVLLKADQPAGNYWISSSVRSRLPKTPQGLAIINYEGTPLNNPVMTPPIAPAWNDTNATFAQILKYEALPKAAGGDTPTPPPAASKKITLLGLQARFQGKLKWVMNNVSYQVAPTPTYLAIKSKKYKQLGLFDTAPPPANPAYDFDYTQPQPFINGTVGNGVYVFKLNEVVDVVLQNANTLTPNNSEVHPWHLHGHHFWVMGQGHGKFNPATDPATYNLVNPPLRHTHPVASYGWTTIRYIANNPGVWSFHCHLAAHQQMGMEVVVADGLTFPNLPSGFKKCGRLN